MLLVLGVVLTGLGSFAMVAWPRDDAATEAAMKYLVFGAVTGSVMIYGLTFWFGGSGSTPNMAVYRAGDFQTFTGPSCRIVMDVGDWDNSVFVNLPGQSGDPRSPHYTDMKTEWLTGGYRPLLYTAAAVDAATEAVVTLTPAG